MESCMGLAKNYIWIYNVAQSYEANRIIAGELNAIYLQR